MPRTKTKIAIVHRGDPSDEVVDNNVLIEDGIVDTQALAEKWVREHGEEDVDYHFFRHVRTVTKKIKKIVVLV